LEKENRQLAEDRNAGEKIVNVCRLGRVDYQTAWDVQTALSFARAQNTVPDTLLLLEHPPVYTLGIRGDEAHFLVSKKKLAEEGVTVYHTNRGGDVTYHGPGQLVGYPILNLRGRTGGVGRYLRDLEEVLIRSLSGLGVASGRLSGFTGVWVGNEKIAAIGIHLSAHGITRHGFSLNVNTDLGYFNRIIPCGIRDKGVTSLAQVLGHSQCLDHVADRITAAFRDVFLCKIRKISVDSLLDNIGDYLDRQPSRAHSNTAKPYS